LSTWSVVHEVKNMEIININKIINFFISTPFKDIIA